MSGNTLKFNNIRLNKKEFHKSKHLIELSSVSVDQIVISDRLSIATKDLNTFIGYKKDEIVKPLCIILPQMSGHIKYFENGGKNMSFFMKDDKICEKYKQIWDAIRNKLGIKFQSKPIYEEKYLKVKGKEFDGVVKTNFLSNGIPKENIHYTCIACITIDSVMKIGKKNCPQAYLEECKYRVKKIQMSRFISTELDSDSEAETKSDTELMTKLESSSDSE